MTKKYDAPRTPFQRVLTDTGAVPKAIKTRLARENELLNPAAIQREIQAFTAKLLKLTISKKGTRSQADLARNLT